MQAIIQTEYQKNIKTLGNPVFSRVFLCFGFIKDLYEKKVSSGTLFLAIFN